MTARHYSSEEQKELAGFTQSQKICGVTSVLGASALDCLAALKQEIAEYPNGEVAKMFARRSA